MDIGLKQRPSFWETPRIIAILVGSVAAISSAAAGYAGYQIGSKPPPAPQPLVIYNSPPPPALQK